MISFVFAQMYLVKEVVADCQAVPVFFWTEEIRFTRSFSAPEVTVSRNFKGSKDTPLTRAILCRTIARDSVVANEKHKLPAVCNTI